MKNVPVGRRQKKRKKRKKHMKNTQKKIQHSTKHINMTVEA